MNIKRTTLLLALGMVLTGPVWAQDAEKPVEAAAAKDAPAEGEKAKEPAEGEKAKEPAEGEKSEGSPATGETPQGEGQPAEVPLGPGGKPIRADYPGTDEAMRSRMETDKIQGLQVDPNAPEEAYSMRVEELQTKVDDLKEKVFQSKTRVVLLRETLLSGNAAGARAVIIHKTDLGSAFKLREALYSLDGAKIFGQIDKNGSLSDKNTFEVYNGAISPGNHTLSVTLKYQGSGYGLFTYFDGYDFEIQNSCPIKGEEGKIIQLNVVAFAEGDITTSKENQPSLRCDVQYFENVPQEGDAPSKSEE